MINRINLILQAMNITARQFAEEIGVQPSGMSHILSGRNNPSLDFIMKVINRYPEINTDWLMFGKGAMYNSSLPDADNHSTNTVDPIGDTISSTTTKQPSVATEEPNLFSDIDDSKPTPIASIKSPNPAEVKSPIDDMSIDTRDNISPSIMSESEPNKSIPNTPSVQATSSNNRKIIKIVLFYDDHSFSEYHPE